MAHNPDSNDRYVEALDFVITFLRDHEGKLDKLNDQLRVVVDGLGGFKGLSKKLDALDREVDVLEKELARLVAVYSDRLRGSTYR